MQIITINITTAYRKFYEILGRVEYSNIKYHITKRGWNGYVVIEGDYKGAGIIIRKGK